MLNKPTPVNWHIVYKSDLFKWMWHELTNIEYPKYLYNQDPIGLVTFILASIKLDW